MDKDFSLRLAESIMKWYDSHARILPWRESRDPYRIWVSEIMLQQTQVRTVLPFYERFVQTLPDIGALSKADETQLLKLWEGLGYYNRVRNMQRAAIRIMEEFDGQLPASYDLLKTLPGIGEYSAGAISSIAFGLRHAAIDGNVLRVFSRIWGSTEDITDLRVKKKFQGVALELQPPERPGDFNQALMELGATVCLPNGAPLCADCPAAVYCQAFIEGTTGQIPVKTAKAKRKIEDRTILVVIAGQKVLLHKREQNGLLGGLLEPVNLTGWLAVSDVANFLDDAGMRYGAVIRLQDATHIFSHIEWRMRGYLIEADDIAAPSGYFWEDRSRVVSQLAMPAAFKAYYGQIKNISDEGGPS